MAPLLNALDVRQHYALLFSLLFTFCLLVFNDPDEEHSVYAPINWQMSSYLLCLDDSNDHIEVEQKIMEEAYIYEDVSSKETPGTGYMGDDADNDNNNLEAHFHSFSKYFKLGVHVYT
ncbi:hypothetical protein HD554DRAFT_2038692 [Boletus coccyginus]|nr:hypothetical protein HD554DRAFT_2038692 [Boletus coccyginus]